MDEQITYLYDLLEEKKKNVSTEEEQAKVDQIEALLKIPGIFFKLSLNASIGILDFLGIPRESIKEIYMKLTSPESYQKSSVKEYDVIEIPQSK